MAPRAKTQLSSGVEMISPKVAADWMKQNKGNRPLSEMLGDRYAEAMRRGEWCENGESIKFNCDGRLADGQHRLYGVIKSGVTLPMMVVRGVPTEAFVTIDGGKRRSNGDHLAGAGEAHYNQLASALRWFNVIANRKSWKSMALTSKQLFQVLDKEPKIRESVAFAFSTKASKIASGSILGACHYAFSKKDRELADLFLESLATGEGLKRTDPVYILRERFRRERSERSKMPQDVVAAFVVKAWNATRKGEVIKKLIWQSEEAFPQVQ